MARGGGSSGGPKRDRTADLHNAIVALSQLSYGPLSFERPAGDRSETGQEAMSRRPAIQAESEDERGAQRSPSSASVSIVSGMSSSSSPSSEVSSITSSASSPASSASTSASTSGSSSATTGFGGFTGATTFSGVRR